MKNIEMRIEGEDIKEQEFDAGEDYYRLQNF